MRGQGRNSYATDDRISELPEVVMHHILSFLPLKQRVATTILSKTWNNVWITFLTPILEFRDDNFWNLAGKQGQITLMNFVEKTLQRHIAHKVSISRFVIILPQSQYDRNLENNLAQWIGYALDSNVKELKLIIEDFKRYSNIRLKLPPRIMMKNNFSMKSLILGNVYVDDQIIQHLISTSPDLEHLFLNRCLIPHLQSLDFKGEEDCGKFNFSGNTNLRILELFRVSATEEWLHDLLSSSSSLELLKISHCNPWPRAINLSANNNLKTLLLDATYIEDHWFEDLFTKCPLLEDLEVCGCYKLESIKISSHTLKKLCIQSCPRLMKVEIDTPHLSSFKYLKRHNIISLSSRNTLDLSVASLGFDDHIWGVKVAEFLGNFNHCKHVNFRSVSYKHMIIPKGQRKTLLPPLYGVNHLRFSTFRSVAPIDYLSLVDSLLWISPHLESLSIIELGSTKTSFKFLYEHLMNIKENSSLPIVCWQHCLKEVQITSGRDQDERNLKNYFVENAKILEKIDFVSL